MALIRFGDRVHWKAEVFFDVWTSLSNVPPISYSMDRQLETDMLAVTFKLEVRTHIHQDEGWTVHAVKLTGLDCAPANPRSARRIAATVELDTSRLPEWVNLFISEYAPKNTNQKSRRYVPRRK